VASLACLPGCRYVPDTSALEQEIGHPGTLYFKLLRVRVILLVLAGKMGQLTLVVLFKHIYGLHVLHYMTLHCITLHYNHTANWHVLTIMQADLCRAHLYNKKVMSLYLLKALSIMPRHAGCGTASLEQRYTKDVTAVVMCTG
jgi:hypothetical protein